MMTEIFDDLVHNPVELRRRDRIFILHEYLLPERKWFERRVKIMAVKKEYVNLATLDDRIGFSFTFKELLDDNHRRYLTLAPPNKKLPRVNNGLLKRCISLLQNNLKEAKSWLRKNSSLSRKSTRH
jgi:hypothetical protein